LAWPEAVAFGVGAPTDVSATDGRAVERPNQLAKVSVGYTYQFMNPLLWPFFPGGQITLNVESAMKNEGAPAS